MIGIEDVDPSHNPQRQHLSARLTRRHTPKCQARHKRQSMIGLVSGKRRPDRESIGRKKDASGSGTHSLEWAHTPDYIVDNGIVYVVIGSWWKEKSRLRFLAAAARASCDASLIKNATLTAGAPHVEGCCAGPLASFHSKVSPRRVYPNTSHCNFSQYSEHVNFQDTQVICSRQRQTFACVGDSLLMRLKVRMDNSH